MLFASALGDDKALQFLLLNGFAPIFDYNCITYLFRTDPNEQDKDGQTALHYACTVQTGVCLIFDLFIIFGPGTIRSRG